MLEEAIRLLNESSIPETEIEPKKHLDSLSKHQAVDCRANYIFLLLQLSVWFGREKLYSIDLTYLSFHGCIQFRKSIIGGR